MELFKESQGKRYSKGEYLRIVRDFNRFCVRWKVISWKRCFTYFTINNDYNVQLKQKWASKVMVIQQKTVAECLANKHCLQIINDTIEEFIFIPA